MTRTEEIEVLSVIKDNLLRANRDSLRPILDDSHCISPGLFVQYKGKEYCLVLEDIE
jgi:hypothetical protein